MQNKVKVQEEKYASIIDAVCYWLGYQFKIGREQLIHEASIRYPVTDLITSKGIAVERIVLEKCHPIFESKKIDMVIYDETVKHSKNEKDDSKLIEVFEFKLAKCETAKKHKKEHQRVFDDVVRLGYYNMWGKKECYFLMCGTYQNFKTYFVGQKGEMMNEDNRNIVTPRKAVTSPISGQPTTDKWQPEGLYKDWFSFILGESKSKKFDDTDDNWGLKPFQNKYIPRDDNKYKFDKEIEITTTCVAITPVGEKMKTHAAGIWKIEAK